MNWKHITLALVGGGAAYAGFAAHTAPSRLLGRFLDPVPNAMAEQSGTRLKAKFIAGADGSQLFEPEVLHDSQLDVDCVFGLAADDTTRCLPTLPPAAADGWANVYFKDDACTQGFVQLQAPPAGCTPTPPKYVYVYGAIPYCGLPEGNKLPSVHVFPLGSVVAPPQVQIYEFNGSGKCIPKNGQQQGTFIHYSIGAEVPASTFVAGTAGVEP